MKCWSKSVLSAQNELFTESFVANIHSVRYPFSLSLGARQGECLWCTISAKPASTEVMTRARTLYSWGCITQLRWLLRTCALNSKHSQIVFILEVSRCRAVGTWFLRATPTSGWNTSNKATPTQNKLKTWTFFLSIVQVFLPHLALGQVCLTKIWTVKLKRLSCRNK